MREDVGGHFVEDAARDAVVDVDADYAALSGEHEADAAELVFLHRRHRLFVGSPMRRVCGRGFEACVRVAGHFLRAACGFVGFEPVADEIGIGGEFLWQC